MFITDSYKHKKLRAAFDCLQLLQSCRIFVWPPSDFCLSKNLRTEKTALK